MVDPKRHCTTCLQIVAANHTWEETFGSESVFLCSLSDTISDVFRADEPLFVLFVFTVEATQRCVAWSCCIIIEYVFDTTDDSADWAVEDEANGILTDSLVSYAILLVFKVQRCRFAAVQEDIFRKVVT